MSAVKTLIQLAERAFVHPARDERRAAGDEPEAAAASGDDARTSGVALRRSVRIAYAIVGAVVVAATLVDAFSKAQEISWRLGAPGNLWEPLLWNITSGGVMLALLPLARRAALLVRGAADRPVKVGLATIALAVGFSAIHIALMFPLRKLAYAVAGWDYEIRWSQARVLYELRKDLFDFAVLAVIFGLAERPAALRAVHGPAVDLGKTPEPTPSELWLRDGRISVLIDPREILSVSSAGNYVEYVLTGGRRHLIRATLQAEAARLGAFGLARVHRTRLVNLKRVVALESRPSGDFELRLDSGETVVGSRRFRTAVAGLGA